MDVIVGFFILVIAGIIIIRLSGFIGSEIFRFSKIVDLFQRLFRKMKI